MTQPRAHAEAFRHEAKQLEHEVREEAEHEADIEFKRRSADVHFEFVYAEQTSIVEASRRIAETTVLEIEEAKGDRAVDQLTGHPVTDVSINTQGEPSVYIDASPDAHRELVAGDRKGKIHTRWKFWSVILGTTVGAVAGAVSAVIGSAVLYALDARDKEPPPNPENVPPDVQQLLLAMVRLWRNMPAKEGMETVATYVERNPDLSIYAQLLMLGDLKLLAPQPKELRGEWDLKTATELLDQLYAKRADPPAMYRLSAQLKRDGRDVTFHEAATLSDYVVSRIIKESKKP